MNGKSYAGAKVLITGGTGSIGLEIARAILRYRPKRVTLFSNDENGLFEAMSVFGNDPRFEYKLGDVRDSKSVEAATSNCDIVFHAAALKHVDFCEQNPAEAIYTNIVGTQVTIDSAIKNRARCFVYIGTDKAINPAGTLGATKLLGEKLTIDASKRSRAKFTCVRFGNVIGSRGSVVLIFERQVRNGRPITVTNPEMTRFLMLPSEAARLVLQAAEVAKSGEIFVLKMRATKIGDLADACREFFSKRYGKDPEKTKIVVIRPNPGEKINEELMTSEEALRTQERHGFYVIRQDISRRFSASSGLPAIASNTVPLLSKAEILSILSKLYDH